VQGQAAARLIELGIGVGAAVVTVAARIPFEGVAGDRAPYALNFLAVVIAAVLAGWRSGLFALVVGQLLIWYAIVPPVFSFAIEDAERLGGLIIATLSQALMLVVISLYQREVDKGATEREQRVALLDEALKEIDHRTRNNYQTVLAMIDLQARRAADGPVADALRQIADRIQAVAIASQQLAVRSGDLDAVRLDDHLCGLIQQIERGLSRDGIDIECDVDDVTASADAATSISIIVNELVTNAIKHAFNGERPGRVMVTGRTGSAFELIIADDGRGMEATRRKDHDGLGTKLVESFARQLGAQHEVLSSDKGTAHRLVIPSLN
jgi:two-component sensor histidine kinase